MLTVDELKELKDIVGEEWVKSDLPTRDAYSIYYNSSSLNKEDKLWTARPAAVIMPKTPQEISGLTKFCNKKDFMLKPFSTGWITSSAPGSRKTILLDLRRMDKIIDIDLKNQIAVVEPYVRAIDLQSELWKHGLNVHAVSCGGNHSILASTAAAWGYGITGASMGYQARNMLGVEWVMPSGEILSLGSPGDGAEWFSTDGPGPGIRGLIRGFQGTFGGLGTFTKVGVKLYRWDSDPEYEVHGKSPKYILNREMPNLGVFILMFPGKKEITDAGYKLGEAECNYSDFRMPAFFIALGFTDNNLELKQLWSTGVFQKLARYVLTVCVHGHSKKEYQWKVKALKQIVRESGGLILPMQQIPVAAFEVVKPFFKMFENPLKIITKIPLIQEIADMMSTSKEMRLKLMTTAFFILVRHAINSQGGFRASSGMFTSVGAFDTWDMGFEQADYIASVKRPAIDKGLILDDGGDLGSGGTFDFGHLGYIEGIGEYSTNDPESRKATKAIVEESLHGTIERSLGLPIAAFGGPMNQLFGPHCYNYHEMIMKIKEKLDPNSSYDSWTYSGPSEKAFADEKEGYTFF